MSNFRYSYLDFAKDVLKTATIPLSFLEIWEEGQDKAFFSKLSIASKTPEQTLGARLYVDVRDNPNSHFIKVGRQPARFFLKSRESELPNNWLSEVQKKEEPAEFAEQSSESSKNIEKEKDLHTHLAFFAYWLLNMQQEKNIYTKTINHSKSRNTGHSKWTHPDMVGVYMPIFDWPPNILKLNELTDNNSMILYSFELKLEIDNSNYWQYFSQAVSNSSWAHEGYLVTSSLSQLYSEKNSNLRKELERLSKSFGIGVIELDIEDIFSSSVIFPAQRRYSLDWEFINKLANKNQNDNTDFKIFIDSILRDRCVNSINPDNYDKVYEIKDE